MIKIYNTLTRKKEEFKPVKEGEVGLYCCGPTVYWHQHIGNLRTYISEDLLKRMFQYNGYKVNHVVNVTDVGHLTSDADEGEDKLMKAIKNEGLPLNEDSMKKIANKYLDGFLIDLEKLHVINPNVWCKATEHVNEMIELVKKLDKKGFTYKTSVGLIYDTSKFKDYAKLGKLNLEQLEEGASGKKDAERRNSSDFALWLSNQPNHVMQWDSPWGKGFPGWHLECSAMSMKYLGEHFDVHCGGKEHIQVHHTNEIAQSEGATGKKWVNYWVHTNWLEMKEGKMSKSSGDIIRLKDLMEKDYDPLAYRYFCFTAHYKSPLTFSWEALDAAQNAFNGFKSRIIELKKDLSSNETENSYSEDFKNAVNDDLNVPKALGIMWDVLKDKELGNKEKYELVKDFDKIFGFDIDSFKEEEIPEEIMKIVKEREVARKEFKWDVSDKMRDELKDLGYHVEDSKKGSRVKRL